MDELINQYYFKPEFPLYLEQDATIKAKKSMLFTNFRWVVEVINSFLKKSLKALDGVSNSQLNHTLDDYRIAAAIITYGTYQINQAKSYLDQHFATNGKNEIWISSERFPIET